MWVQDSDEVMGRWNRVTEAVIGAAMRFTIRWTGLDIQENTEALRDRVAQRKAGEGVGMRAQVSDEVMGRGNRVTEAVIGAAMEVHSVLGPGLLEWLYEEALSIELRNRGIAFERQRPVRVTYKGFGLGDQFLDMVVEGFLVLELKSIDRVSEVHLGQLVSYLRSGGFPLGLLINFNTARLKDGLFRRINTPQTQAPESFLSES